VRRFRVQVLWGFLWLPAVAGIWALVITSVINMGRARPFATVVVFLFIGFLAFKMSRRIARPIEALTEATRRLGAGELSYRVPLPWRHPRHHPPHPRRRPPRDELTALTRSFNEMAERIERLVRGQKELLANVSHELRSPLARIRVALELVPRTPENERRLAGLEDDLEELTALIDDVLTASRLDGDAAPPRKEVVSLDRLVDGLVERAGLDPQLAGVPVEKVGAGGELEADPALLRRALWNLLENAGKHGAPPITVALARAGGEVRISVADRGAGIPVEERERVFLPFARLDAARTARGVGLGLTIARRVAEVHGGTLTAGEGEHGFAMTLALPAAAAAA
jgi:signal transduction histidine kinase